MKAKCRYVLVYGISAKCSIRLRICLLWSILQKKDSRKGYRKAYTFSCGIPKLLKWPHISYLTLCFFFTCLKAISRTRKDRFKSTNGLGFKKLNFKFGGVQGDVVSLLHESTNCKILQNPIFSQCQNGSMAASTNAERYRFLSSA